MDTNMARGGDGTTARAQMRGPWYARRSTQEAAKGYAFISPWIIGFLLFSLGPMLASIYLSLAHFDIASAPRFIGLGNYRHAFRSDPLFWSSLGRTAVYTLLSVPLGIAGSLFVAALLNQEIHGKALFRTLFFLPSLTPVVASGLLWSWLLQPQVGLINYVLWHIGIIGPGWLSDPSLALPCLVGIALWGGIGGSRMIIFLAGLQGIPQELLEAANLDGAGAWIKFWHVTVPMLTPVIFFNLVLGLIDSLGVFAIAYVATDGGPAYATWFYMLHLVNQALRYFDMGYASALAWIFFVIVMAFTYLQVRMAKRWVYYAGEEQ